jgi:hypothetical protein
MSYETTADEMVRRIRALIADHPEILRMTNPFDLFTIDQFSCGDLCASLAQAQAALATAKQQHLDGVK